MVSPRRGPCLVAMPTRESIGLSLQLQQGFSTWLQL